MVEHSHISYKSLNYHHSCQVHYTPQFLIFLNSLEGVHRLLHSVNIIHLQPLFLISTNLNIPLRLHLSFQQHLQHLAVFWQREMESRPLPRQCQQRQWEVISREIKTRLDWELLLHVHQSKDQKSRYADIILAAQVYQLCKKYNLTYKYFFINAFHIIATLGRPS